MLRHSDRDTPTPMLRTRPTRHEKSRHAKKRVYLPYFRALLFLPMVVPKNKDNPEKRQKNKQHAQPDALRTHNPTPEPTPMHSGHPTRQPDTTGVQDSARHAQNNTTRKIAFICPIFAGCVVFGALCQKAKISPKNGKRISPNGKIQPDALRDTPTRHLSQPRCSGHANQSDVLRDTPNPDALRHSGHANPDAQAQPTPMLRTRQPRCTQGLTTNVTTNVT